MPTGRQTRTPLTRAILMTALLVLPEDGTEYTVGPWLTFDPETEQHVGDFADEANALLKDPNNAGFEVPTLDSV